MPVEDQVKNMLASSMSVTFVFTLIKRLTRREIYPGPWFEGIPSLHPSEEGREWGHGSSGSTVAGFWSIREDGLQARIGAGLPLSDFFFEKYY